MGVASNLGVGLRKFPKTTPTIPNNYHSRYVASVGFGFLKNSVCLCGGGGGGIDKARYIYRRGKNGTYYMYLDVYWLF